MKTRFSLRLLLTVAFIAILTASCSKEDDFHPSGQPVGDNSLLGQIVDNGLVADNLRQMTVSIVNQGNVYDGYSDDFLGKARKITFNVFTTEDGFISSGTYAFNADGTLEPFTFGEGSIIIESSDLSAEIKEYAISSGTLDVFRYAEGYTFYLTLFLDSGNVINISTGGKMAYEDAY